MKKLKTCLALLPAMLWAVCSFGASAEVLSIPNTGDKGFPVGIIIVIIVCIVLIIGSTLWYIFMQNKKK